MAPRVPDEIISEILAPILHVPDVQFSYTAIDKSPFAARRQSTSDLLLVCEAWLRVCTPLLYKVVVLRSTAQAKGLLAALKKNPKFGQYIKKLRVEGGFRATMHEILKFSPNITDLFLSLRLDATDSVSGLVSGLPLISPQRLIIGDAWDPRSGMKQNKQVKDLMGCLQGLGKKWSKLRTLVAPETYAERHDFIAKMVSASGVHTVSFPLDIDSDDDTIPKRILDFAGIKSIQTVQIRMSISDEDAERLLSHPNASKYRSKLRIVDAGPIAPPEFIAGLPTDPNFVPLATSAQETVGTVWGRVLFFAMYPVAGPTSDLGPELGSMFAIHVMKKREQTNKESLQYLLVSKIFRAIGLEYLYRWPVLTRENAVALARKLSQEPSLGLHIDQLSVSPLSTTSLTGIPPLFTHTPRLTRLGLEYAVRMDWAVFCSLAEGAGASLVDLSVSLEGTSKAPDAAVFCLFKALRKLTWDSSGFSMSPSKHASDGLPALECLVLEDHKGFLPALTSMQLPKLRKVIFPSWPSTKRTAEHYAFLGAHGSKILELEIFSPDMKKTLSLCPNLRTLQLNLGLPTADSLEAHTESYNRSQTHTSLVKLVFNKGRQRNQKNDEADWETVFDAVKLLDPQNLPELCEVRCIQCLWPKETDSEQEIKKNKWVKRAASMLEHGFDLTDNDGVQWRPRLTETKTVTKSKAKSKRK